MTQMLNYWTKTIKQLLLTRLQEVTVSIIEMNEKLESLSKEMESVENNPKI